MSHNGAAANGVNGDVQTEASTAALLSELQAKLAAYDGLEQEISKLAQEQTTLENYVKNLMDSNVRAKAVNYYEEVARDSDESDFELSY
ncbi:hypothetical protein LPJ70_006028, partial [Coemansia sp. RSA 2708]